MSELAGYEIHCRKSGGVPLPLREGLGEGFFQLGQHYGLVESSPHPSTYTSSLAPQGRRESDAKP